MSPHDPVIEGETEVGIQQNDEGRNENDHNDNNDRHLFLDIHPPPQSQTRAKSTYGHSIPIYLISAMVYWTSPDGIRIRTVSPCERPIRAFPTGE